MKKITTLCLLLVCGVSFGQFCEEFDQYSTTSLINGTNGNNGTIVSPNLLDNWGTICSSIAYYDTNSQNGAGDNYLYLDDGPCSNGSSWAFNSTDYTGNWMQMVQDEGCFCYDFRTFEVASGTIGGNSLRIYDGSDPTNSTLGATFVLSSPIDVSRGWVRICAPIGFADASGNLPSNSDGQWVINTGNAGDWDTLIQSVNGIAYSIDVASGNELFGIDNICISPDCDSTFTTGEPNDEGAFCCEGENLVENGNFENGSGGFASDYTEDASVYPGAYTISDDASIFGATITDHSACVDPTQFGANTDFLLVNGRTTQPSGTTAVIWEQSVQIDSEKNYKFCANFKNMPQCTFDIKPEIRLEVNGQLSEWITIDTNSDDPCDWQQISECFEGDQDVLDIKIHLKEDGLGDGNDLAIDDISLQAKLDQNLSISVLHQGNPQQLTGSINSIDTTDDTLLVQDICVEQNNGYQYNWFVYELASYPITQPIDFINMVPDSFAWSSNIGGFNNQLPTSANPVWGLTTTFPNYTFENNRLYVIGLYVPSCCDSCYDEAWSYQITFSSENDAPPAMNVFTEEIKDHIRSLFVLGEGGNGTLGREDNEVINFTMFPNPTSDVLRFNSDETIVSYKITDITGKLIQSKAIEVSEIDVSQLSSNMYFLTVTTDSGINHTEKFIKK
ncbi:T9SS type A sorting domain-containing protein [Kordia sp. YSTF-M3]|uniref:T9SS type A sorting domain-containing protein n=1 Tax=Kordia aestuariivivens TaxID=2759037 RepID=A0ABR7QAL9_9FLAO|nr:T9SS type A sorting domain-containing protein [Kordia aestuariivivens]MBC8755391.1 T9SS type A sorting domain-containing protein [Kordia aestuariivivens]